MNIFKRILGHIYFVYAGLWFALTLLLVTIPIYIVKLLYGKKIKKRALVNHQIFLIWMKIYLTTVFIFVKRKGLHHFAPGENFVVVINHNSFADIPISSPFVPGANKTLAKMDMMKIPIFNIIYEAGSILVDRKSEESRKASVKLMQDTLNLGLHLVLYPEGTRNKTKEVLQPFFDGAFRTAIHAQKAIIPACLFNTKYILPRKPAFWAWPYTVRFEFLPPVPTVGLSINDTQELKDKVHEIMKNYLIQNEKK